MYGDTSSGPVRDRDEWMRRTGPLYPALVALRQLTRVPVLRGVVPTADDLTRAGPWFPAVGGFVGGLIALAALFVLETELVPAIAAAVVLTGAIAITGALHEAGFSRVIESLFSGDGRGYEPESSFHRQPLGIYGVAAAAALVAVRGVLLLGIDTRDWIAAVLISQIVLRWVPLLLLRLGDHLGEPMPGERSLMVGGPSWLALGAGSAFTLAVALLFGGLTGLLSLALAAAVAFGVGVFFQRRSGGLGSSSLAASSVLCELTVLLCFAAAHPAVQSPWAR